MKLSSVFQIRLGGMVALLSMFALMTTPLASEEATPSDLKKAADGNAFEHAPSKSRFQVPAGWAVLPPRTFVQSSFLGLRQGEAGIEATLSWSPLAVDIKEAVQLEHGILAVIYGKDKDMKDKVSPPEPVTAAGKSGYKMTIADGPSRNGKEAGVVYLFAIGSGNSGWKLKMRATFSNAARAENLKALEALLENLKW